MGSPCAASGNRQRRAGAAGCGRAAQVKDAAQLRLLAGRQWQRQLQGRRQQAGNDPQPDVAPASAAEAAVVAGVAPARHAVASSHASTACTPEPQVARLYPQPALRLVSVLIAGQLPLQVELQHLLVWAGRQIDNQRGVGWVD